MGNRSTNKNKALNTPVDGHLLGYFNSLFNAGGGGGTALGPRSGPFEATGGNATYTYGGKKIHVWTSPGTLTTSGNCLPMPGVSYVCIGGGAGSGGGLGGGGGAGAYRIGTIEISGTVASNTVTVGAGGAGWTGAPTNSGSLPSAYDGGQSDFAPGQPYQIISKGGGAGAGYNGAGNASADNPAPAAVNGYGGSGGGGSGCSGQPGGASGGAGNDGGAGRPCAGSRNGGGGGGASGAGQAGPSGYSGGGKGVQLPATFQDPTNPYGYPITGPSPGVWGVAAGGGGGSDGPGSGYGGAGGDNPGSPSYGAGDGSPTGGAGTAAQANSGSGAGGGGNGTNGAAGGSGLVMIAYPE